MGILLERRIALQEPAGLQADTASHVEATIRRRRVGNVSLFAVKIEPEPTTGVVVGYTALRVIAPKKGDEIAECLRAAGYAVTTFLGEGMSGGVRMLYLVLPRKELETVLTIVKKISPEAFYITR